MKDSSQGLQWSAVMQGQSQPLMSMTIPSELECGLCGSLLANPHSASPCGHKFCGSCLPKYPALFAICPSCGCAKLSQCGRNASAPQCMQTSQGPLLHRKGMGSAVLVTVSILLPALSSGQPYRLLMALGACMPAIEACFRVLLCNLDTQC